MKENHDVGLGWPDDDDDHDDDDDVGALGGLGGGTGTMGRQGVVQRFWAVNGRPQGTTWRTGTLGCES